MTANHSPPTPNDNSDRAGDEFAPRPWERRPDESPAAWAAFQCYRDLGPARSLDEVDRRIYQSSTAPTEGQPSPAAKRRRGHIGAWSRQHAWVERARHWDAEVDRQGRAAHVEAVRAMNERHAASARQLQARAIEALQGLPAGDLAAADVLRFLVEACKLERLAVGEVTERSAQEVTGGAVLEIVERIVPVRGAAPAAGPDPATGAAPPVSHRLVGVLPAGAGADPAGWALPDEPPPFLRPPGR